VGGRGRDRGDGRSVGAKQWKQRPPDQANYNGVRRKGLRQDEKFVIGPARKGDLGSLSAAQQKCILAGPQDMVLGGCAVQGGLRRRADKRRKK